MFFYIVRQDRSLNKSVLNKPDFRARGAVVEIDGVYPLQEEFHCPGREFSPCVTMQTCRNFFVE